MEFSSFFLWSTTCWQFDLWFLCLFSVYLYIWNFLVHIILKPALEDIEYYIASIWNACNGVAVWIFFVIVHLRIWNENWPFSVLWSLSAALSQHYLLGLEIAQLEFHQLHKLGLLWCFLRPTWLYNPGSGFRRVITLFWLSKSLRSFFLSFFVSFCHLFLISSASVRSISLLSFTMPIFAWNVPLVFTIFLKRVQVFPILLFSSISL